MTVDPAATMLERAIADAEAVAAVSGELLGTDLIPPDLSDKERTDALSALAPRFVIARQVGSERVGIRWTLRRRHRHEVLSRLMNTPELDALLARQLPPTDRAGELLREVLVKGRPDVEILSREDLLSLASVIEATERLGLPLPTADELEAVRRKKEAPVEEVLLTQGLVGREQELDILRSFVLSPWQYRNSSGWEGLVISGLGGAGKSTLVAALAEELRQSPTDICAVLDFDRPGIDAEDAYWLEMEVSRQVERQRPNLRDSLRGARRDARDAREGREPQRFASLESTSTDRSRSIIEVLQSAVFDARSIVLVFDTFEEVVQRDCAGILFAWIDELSYRISKPLRVIFSGRLVTEDFASTLLRKESLRVLPLEELAPVAARVLLEKVGVSPERARRLVEAGVIPRRPLDLKLVGRLIASVSEADFRSIEQEISAFDKSSLGELFAALVYRRILLRIRDPDAQRLAYPGLLLRFIDADIVERVLVPALGIALEKTPAEAVAELVRYNWLVEPGSRPGQVRHRRDLRRSVVAAMLENDRAVADDVHRAALAYFEASGDIEYRREGLYHQLMLVRTPEAGAQFRPGELVEMTTHLGGDIRDLPRPALALVRLDAMQNFTAEDFDVLPFERREGAFALLGERLSHARQFSQAFALHDRFTAQGTKRTAARWEVETLWATGHFEELTQQLEKNPARDPDDTRFGRAAIALFPNALLDQASVYLSALEEDLSMRASASQVELVRIAAGLASHLAYLPMSREMRHRLGDTFRKLAPSAARDLLLRYVPEASAQVAPKLWVANMRFDAATFAELRRELLPIVVERSRRELDAFLRALENRVTSAEVVATLLASLAQFATSCELDLGLGVNWTPASLSLDARRVLFGGLDVPFRDPVRYAVLETVGGNVTRLRRAVAGLVDLMPRVRNELTGAQFQETIAPNPEHALEPFVELADRMDVLPAWVERVLTELGGDERCKNLAKVSDVYARWRRDVDLSIENMRTTDESEPR